MKIDYNHVQPQIDELLTTYKGLKEESNDYNTSIIISGSVSINRTYNNYLVDKEYEIRIFIPINNDKLPEAWDIGNHIDKSYVHRYSDGRLCLETDAYIALCLYNGYSLLQWMKNIVEPYYYSYEYYTRFGEFPFGERGHDIDGIVETYQEVFKEQDTIKVCKLLRAISQKEYRGHLPCPCDSGVISRKCHGKYIYPFFCDENLNSIAKKDYLRICKEKKKYVK